MVEEFRANLNLVNKRLAEESHKGTSFDPEKRAIQEIEGFGQYVNGVYDSLKKYAKTEAQKEYLNSEMERFQRGFAAKYNERLAAEGRTISSFITGGSKFPVRRAEKANIAEQKRYEEMTEYRDKAQAAILRELKKMAVEEAGGEIEVLKKKIADAERNHEFMVKANVIVRKKIPDDQKVKEIMALGTISETTAREILKPDVMGRVGFAAYQLSNDTANIHRMKERLIELGKKEATTTSEIAFTGGTIIDNKEMDRVQIIFDQKPPESILGKLRGEGWRWSPSNSAWQRKRTPQALQSAMRITGTTIPLSTTDTTPVPATPTNIQPAKYKLGQMVYSYQNPAISAPIIAIHLSDDPQYSHTYILRIPGREGIGTRNSNNINEESLSETPLEPPQTPIPRPTPIPIPIPTPTPQPTNIFQQTADKIRSAQTLGELETIRNEMNTIPLFANEKSKLLELYSSRYSILTRERLFGVPIPPKQQEKPRILGAPTRQQQFEEEQRRKAEAEKRARGQQKLTAGAAGSKRLFEFGIKERAQRYYKPQF